MTTRKPQAFVTSRHLVPVLLAGLIFAAVAAVMAVEVRAQLRRAGRLQKKIEKMQEQRANKLKPVVGAPDASANAASGAGAGSPESAPPKAASQSGKHSLDGARERGPRAILREDERDLLVQGFGNPVATILILRQLDLTDDQKLRFKAIRRSIGKRLTELMNEHRQADVRLTDAIYGENFDPKHVEEVAAQVAEKQSEIIKLRASVESQYRQVLTPDQFYVFHFLIGEMVIPQRRIPPAQLRQQMQRQMQQRMGLPNPPPQNP